MTFARNTARPSLCLVGGMCLSIAAADIANAGVAPSHTDDSATGTSSGTASIVVDGGALSLRSATGGGVEIRTAMPETLWRLHPGEVIESVAGVAVDTPEAFFATLRGLDPARGATVVLRRGTAHTTRVIDVPAYRSVAPPAPPEPPA
jgi:hypothetical protein